MVRFIAFCLSGFFAGVAGGLAAINFEIVNASYVGVQQSGVVLLAAYIGGIGHFSGRCSALSWSPTCKSC